MADPTLFLDRRDALAGAPGLHAVLIGVSDYTYLSDPDEDPPGPGLAALQKLKSSALTALSLADKLVALDAEKRLLRPLATIRLLVAASAEEIETDARLAAPELVLPTIDNIEKALIAWRKDVVTRREHQALFLFSGHGVRSSLEESILLAQDFLEPEYAEMSRSFRLSNIRNGMVPSHRHEEIGREQFYFVDACRDRPDVLGEIHPIDPPAIFTAELNIQDDRKAPIFFATTTGGVAAGETGQPTYFGNALLWAMENGSFSKQSVPGITGSVWPMHASSLKAGIEVFDPLFQARVELTGFVSNPILCFRRDAPALRLKVALRPDELTTDVAMFSFMEINSKKQSDFALAVRKSLLEFDITAGNYQVTVMPDPESVRMKVTSSEVIYFSIQEPMPWPIELVGAP